MEFKYKARDKKGTIIEGTIEAMDKSSAAKSIGDRGLVPLTIDEIRRRSMELSPGALLKKIRGIPSIEKVTFARQLATMIQAGLPLVQALTILEAQSQNEKMKKVISDLARNVEGGLSLSASLSKHPKVFSPLFVSVIKAGEVGGFLDQVLDRLATQLEKEHEINGKIRGAFVYPAVILFAMIAVSVLMLILVIPKLAELFVDAGVELPLPTKILIFLSDLLVGFWWIILPVIAAGGFLFFRWLKTPKGRNVFDRVILKFPVFGKLIKKLSMSRFNRMLGALLTSGIAVLDALQITADSVGNVKYKEAVLEVAKKVKVGVPMAEPLRSSPLFTPLVSQMIAVGEKTGTLDKILERLAIFYEGEVDRIVNNLTTLLEPLIILLMGVGVAFLVISLILPILQLSTTF